MHFIGRMAGLMLASLNVCGTLPMSGAEAGAADEYRVKGAYLLNFTQFVEWPGQAFKSAGDAISICIVGLDPFGPALAAAAREMSASSRPIIVRQISEGRQARQCQIAFVSASEKKRGRALPEEVAGGNVLTVGESDEFLARGGVIDLKIEGGRVRVEINTTAADRAGLRISAKLLSLAKSSPKPGRDQ